MQILLFYLNEKKYGIELKFCKEIDLIYQITYIQDKKSKNFKNYVEGITNLRGELITVMNIKKLLQLENSYSQNTNSNEAREIYLIRLNLKKGKLGILVDKVWDIINIESQSIEESRGHISEEISKFIKFTVLYQHEPILIINPELL